MSRRNKRLVVAAGVVTVLFVMVNIAAELFVSARLGPTIEQFRRSHPAAYAHSPFYSLEFIDEQTALSMSWRQGDTLTGWDSNFHGRFFNIDHGIRRTAFQPPNALHTVWMLGNSTLFDYEVPDELTIASQLQQMFNTTYGPRYRVVNLGQTGLGVAENLTLLKKLPIHRGDIVIAYDGLSEAFALRVNEDTRRNSTLSGRICNGFVSGPVGKRGLVNLYCAWVDSALPPPILNPALPTIERTRQKFQDNLVEAYRYSTERGVNYYHFLPPHIWSKTPSTYEQFILADPYLTPPGTGDSFAMMWPALQAARLKLANAGLPSVDLTHSLDRIRADGQELYLDFVHVTEVGDAIIAAEMFQAVGTF